MGGGSSVVKCLDFVTDFVPGVNLVKNASLAIYDAATGDIDGAADRAIKTFTSAISTATLGAGDEFVLAGDAALDAVEGTVGGDAVRAALDKAPDVVSKFAKTQIGCFPITAASVAISHVSSAAYKYGTAPVATKKEHALNCMQSLAFSRKKVPIQGKLHHWKRMPDYVVDETANWNNMQQIVEDCDLKKALEIAHTKNYPCFFYCWEAMRLEANANRSFKARDAVFFRTGNESVAAALAPCDLFLLQKAL